MCCVLTTRILSIGECLGLSSLLSGDEWLSSLLLDPFDHLAFWEELTTLGVSLSSPPSQLLSLDFWLSLPSLHYHCSGLMLTLLDIFLVSPDLLMAFDSVNHSSPLASLPAASWSPSYFHGSCYSASMLVSLTLAIPQMWCLPGQCPGTSLPTCYSGGFQYTSVAVPICSLPPCPMSS